MLISWESEFFSYGHKYEYIENMNYWSFLEIINGFTEAEKESNTNDGKKSKYKELKPSQKLMMKKRQEERLKEGIKHA